ncbi:acetyl-CoA carboxylase biotin carboxyl carrier protein subunit [Flavisphingomonas formosensis]|uniref:acetyl-CoA carboxylase biotin carboxyl carrier protein subunit n=1 Tax=Flavisphingomonas formosensis TaxID=861534 RepID=UPI0018DF3C7B|nr:acetyl-CoA carboxylase biotin carboxyl carrier protein subunit [Sphingomonas formosensis]
MIAIEDALHRVWLSRDAQGYVLHLGAQQWPVALDGTALRVAGAASPVTIAVDGDRVYVHIDGAAHELVYQSPIAFHAAEAGGPAEDMVRAPMPGSVIATPVTAGDSVAAGDTLIVIESMKLETAVKAPRDGVVETVNFAVGQSFERDALLVTLASQEG